MSNRQFDNKCKNNRVKRVFEFLGCCISSKDNLKTNKTKPSELVSSSCQCDTPIDNKIIEDGLNNLNNLSSCDRMLDLPILNDSKENCLEANMKLSLEKLDNLIVTLDHIYQFYSKESSSFKEQSTSRLQEIESYQDNKFSNTDIAIHSNNNECFNSDNKDCSSKSESPISTIHFKERVTDDLNKNISTGADDSEIIVGELHINDSSVSKTLGTVSNKLMKHITSIKTEIQDLKNLFSNMKYLSVKESNASLSMSCGELQSSFDKKESSVKDHVFDGEECKFVEAKMRASNFCRFHKLAQMSESKINMSKSGSSHIKVI